jgi:filamentous hemagglutinin
MIPVTGVNGKVIDVPFVFIKDNSGAVKLITGVPPKK